MVDRATTIDTPYFEGPAGILINTIDILPTELGEWLGNSPTVPCAYHTAKDASEHFSKCLLPYVKHMSDPASTDKATQESLERATIVKEGRLTADHQWLQPRVDELRAASSKSAVTSSSRPQKQRVLLLGSGLVAGPAVEVFAGRPDVHLVIGKLSLLALAMRPCSNAASNNLAEAENLVRSRSNVQAISLDVSDQSALSEAVSNSDVVVRCVLYP